MKPYYEDAQVEIFHGGAINILKDLPSESVNCCVTSPPYWGLRDYGTGKWEGGTADCDHVAKTSPDPKNSKSTSQNGHAKKEEKLTRSRCRCGAVRVDEQLGLEETPEEYVAKLVQIFSEVRRVLQNDGTLWLNLGDSYANDTKWGGSTGGKHVSALHEEPIGRGKRKTGLKPKDLVGIPWMVAFALRSAGWWLRQDIIWHKPNPMPESVMDRCTKSHEYVFLLSKSARYFYDAEAIQEPAAYYGPNGHQLSPYSQGFGRRDENEEQGRRELLRQKASESVHGNLPGRSDGGRACNKEDQITRNKRSVWTVTTQPFPEAHFATFPPDLILPCILAGCPAGGTVIDPFMGAGTTALVAKENGRNAIGIELNAEYIDIAARRLSQEVLAF